MNMANKRSKIFGIGLSKTGTSSLAQALQILGIKTLDNMGASRYAAGDLTSIDLDTVEAHEALTDTPIPSFYRELDARYPGSRFILTVRDREGWLKSCMKQFSPRFADSQSEPNRRLFEALYGTNVFDEVKFAAGYDRFVAGVREYFKDRPQDLLVLNVTAGEGWEKLCPFLGKPVPDAPFPKANVTQIRWMRMEDLVAVAEEAGRVLLQRYEGELAPEVQGARRAGRGLRLLDRALTAALGGGNTAAAASGAYKAIVAGLRKLNADIPIVSPAEESPPHSERRRWNHVWLVDPLDGSEAFAGGRDDFSIDIALIEDGRPIYGVVHAPARGTTYHGRTGKGAFRRRADGDAVRMLPARAAAGSSVVGDRTDAAGRGGSVALALCELIDGHPAVALDLASAMEWKLAAAQAVLTAAGWRLFDKASGSELAYNSSGLAATAVGVDPLPEGSEAVG
jgi:3'-phosphoadenosine 5'-phosphosulfate (PAPS) 3'-phosphatase